MNPIVSILIPTYNRQELVKESIESALLQTRKEHEIIIVDNKSTDATWDIVKSYSCKDPRIKIYQNNENLGPVKNWISCVEKSTSPLSCFLFSDDMYAPKFLEKTIPMLFDKNAAFVYSPAVIGKLPWTGGVCYAGFKDDCRIMRNTFIRCSALDEAFSPNSPGAALFRTADLKQSILTKIEGVYNHDFCKNGAGVDWLIYIITALRYEYVRYIAEPLVFFREHENSITVANDSNEVSTGYKIARKYILNALKINSI